MKAPSPLSDDLHALLDAERDIDVPEAAQRARMFARLAPLIVPPGVGGGGLTDGGAGGGAAGGAAGTAAGAGLGASVFAGSAFRAKLVVSMVSAAIGAGGGAAGHAYYASRMTASVVVAAPSDAASVSAPATPTPVEAEPAAAADSTAPVASAAASPSGAARSEDRTRGAASLRAERLLLETASAALMRGDSASAIATLKKHANSFPRGELAQEREVLLVQALAASGDDAAARRRAKEFKEKFPGSLQQGSVDKASRPE
jgi:TolA-binding protein